MKRLLLGTAAGRTALNIERWRALHALPLSNPEKAGCVANDIIADHLIAALCASDGVFLDIGAHIGSVTASVHRHDASVKIIAFEAEPAKAAALRARFPFCELFEVAVGEQEGEAEFFLNPAASGYNSLVPDKNSDGDRIRVRVAALDDLLPDTMVDTIKIDIEGAELGALRGGDALITRGKPTIMFESVGAGANALGYAPEMLWRWFDDHGYVVATPDRVAHNAPGLSLDAFLDAHEYPYRTTNYFALHRDRRRDLRDRARRILGVRA